MSSTDETNDDALVEECIEELDGLFMALDRYAPTAHSGHDGQQFR